MNPTTNDISRALREIEQTELPEDHPRKLAQQAIAEYRKGTVLRLTYDFNEQPRELRQVFYDAAVRFSRRRWWSRWLR